MADVGIIQLIPIDFLTIDDSYQRSIDERRVKRIIKNFNPAYLGVLSVAPNGTGHTYKVFDGQHRLEALRSLGVRDVWCRIADLDQKEQALAFVALQTEHKPPTTVERHHALVTACDPAALKVEAAVQSVGLAIHSTEAPGHIRAVTALYWILGAGGSDHLSEVLGLVIKAWPENPQAFLLPVLKGLSKFLRLYPDVSRADLLRSLSRVQPDQVVRDAATASKAMGYERTSAVCKYIWNLYNWKRTSKRLPERF